VRRLRERYGGADHSAVRAVSRANALVSKRLTFTSRGARGFRARLSSSGGPPAHAPTSHPIDTHAGQLSWPRRAGGPGERPTSDVTSTCPGCRAYSLHRCRVGRGAGEVGPKARPKATGADDSRHRVEVKRGRARAEDGERAIRDARRRWSGPRCTECRESNCAESPVRA